jgi:hypothetical protein
MPSLCFQKSLEADRPTLRKENHVNDDKQPTENSAKTEADAKSIDGHSGKSKTGSHDEKSHDKVGSNTGAGGGKKQERHH